jgi:hypothetical protein
MLFLHMHMHIYFLSYLFLGEWWWVIITTVHLAVEALDASWELLMDCLSCSRDCA